MAEERPGRRKGAAIEHIYRAVRRAQFDSAAWEMISAADRHAVSSSILSSYLQRVREALKSGTFDQEVDRHLSWDALILDQTAWKAVTRRLDEVLASLSEAEVEASARLAERGATAIPTIVGLSAFRSAQEPAQLLASARRLEGRPNPTDGDSSFGIGTKLAKALASEWRCKILMEASVRTVSPSQFVERVGGSMSNIARCFRELAEWGYLELVEERNGGRRGGGVERVYRSVCRAYFDTPTWEGLPLPLREEISQFFLDSYLVQVGEAISTGTFDAELDRHLSWKPLQLDRPAWQDVGRTLGEILGWLPELEAESIARTEDEEQMIPTIVNLACFRAAESQAGPGGEEPYSPLAPM